MMISVVYFISYGWAKAVVPNLLSRHKFLAMFLKINCQTFQATLIEFQPHDPMPGRNPGVEKHQVKDGSQ